MHSDSLAFSTSPSWVFLHEKAYQVWDSAIESSVMTKVKGFGVYNNRVMDVADYVIPTQVSYPDFYYCTASAAHIISTTEEVDFIVFCICLCASVRVPLCSVSSPSSLPLRIKSRASVQRSALQSELLAWHSIFSHSSFIPSATGVLT